MYEEKYVRRGEIYNIRLDNGLGSEQGTFRPGLIISNDAGNNTSPTVVVAYMTTRDHNVGINYGPTKATGRPSYVQCEQLATVDKRRLCNLMGQLTRDEMHEVEDRLDEALDLGYVDETPLKEKEAEIAALKLQKDNLEAEVFRLKKQIAAHGDEMIAKDVEITIRQRMYEKAIDMVADMRINAPKEEPPSPAPEPDPVPEPKPEPKLADINNASFSVLRGAGLPNNVILTLINSRPYKTVEDLKKLPGMSKKLYNVISPRVCCVPVEEEPVVEEEPAVKKVNINTATGEEIMEALGCGKNAAYAVTGHRKRNGNFTSVEELVNLKYWTESLLERHRDKLEV